MKRSKRPRLRSNLRRLYLIGLFLHLYALWPPPPWLFATGVGLVLLGRGLQMWAYGHLQKINALRGPEDLVPTTTGPYARVRNPVAWGSFICDAGYGLMAAAPHGVVAYALVYWWVTVRRVRRYEEPMLAERCGEAYAAYRQSVPRFWPTWGGPGRVVAAAGALAKDAGGPADESGEPEAAAPRGFSWRNVWENGEVSRALGALALMAALRLAWTLPASREGLPGETPWVLGTTIAFGAASLVVQSFEHRPHLTRRWLLGLRGRADGDDGTRGPGRS